MEVETTFNRAYEPKSLTNHYASNWTELAGNLADQIDQSLSGKEVRLEGLVSRTFRIWDEGSKADWRDLSAQLKRLSKPDFNGTIASCIFLDPNLTRTFSTMDLVIEDLARRLLVQEVEDEC